MSLTRFSVIHDFGSFERIRDLASQANDCIFLKRFITKAQAEICSDKTYLVKLEFEQNEYNNNLSSMLLLRAIAYSIVHGKTVILDFNMNCTTVLLKTEIHPYAFKELIPKYLEAILISDANTCYKSAKISDFRSLVAFSDCALDVELDVQYLDYVDTSREGSNEFSKRYYMYLHHPAFAIF